MTRIYIEELHKHIGETVTVAGWVDGRRDHGKLIFLDIRDKSGALQSVALPEHEVARDAADDVRAEWVVSVTGMIKKRPEKMVNKDLPTGDIEMEITDLHVLAQAAELPFEKDGDLNLDTLLDYRPFTLRRTRERAIFKVQHEIIHTYRDALIANGFIEFQAPKIVGGDAEGGAGVFKVQYLHNKDAYLATSPQLYKQIMVGVYERVFATGDVFRAEKHSTTRHLNEITMLDAELAFIEDQYEVMRVLAGVLRKITAHLEKECAAEYKTLSATLPVCPSEFPHLSLREAQQLITKDTGNDCTNEPDLEPAHERWLSEYAKKEYNSDFIFITHFPISKRPFYTMEDPENPGCAKCFDLLFRGVELASGSQRVHDYQVLVERIKAKGLDPGDFSFYLQAFKYGMPPHGGWGMGLERLTEKYLGLENVKEATLFPREINRIDTLLS